MNYQDKMHRYGRIFSVLAILFFISYPLAVSMRTDVWPPLGPIIQGLFGVAPVFWTVGAIEAFTFSPMLGTGGSYIAFVTGNLTNLKVPCAINAMKSAKVEPNTEEGDVISTLAISVSSLVTTIILAIGMVLLSFLQPVLQSPVLKPAFDNILPALFGALGVVFLSKNPKIAVAPLTFMLLLFFFFPGLANSVSVLVPVSAGIAILASRILFEREKRKDQNGQKR